MIVCVSNRVDQRISRRLIPAVIHQTESEIDVERDCGVRSVNQEGARTASILVSTGLGVVGALTYTGASPDPLRDVLAANGVPVDGDVRGSLTGQHFDSLARGQLPL